MKYTVHIYAVVRIKAEEVEASSQIEAIDKAIGETDVEDAIKSGKIEDAEELAGFLVDQHDDTGIHYYSRGSRFQYPAHDKSLFYCQDGKTVCRGSVCTMCGRSFV